MLRVGGKLSRFFYLKKITIMKQYELSPEQLAQVHHTNLDHGLSPEEAAKRLRQKGYNTLPDAPQDSLFLVFLRQFKNPLIYILVIAATLIFMLGNQSDAFFISAIIIFNAIVGTFQEGKAQAILAALKSLATSTSLVIRDGKRCIIEDKNLVVGDIIVLQEGQKVPADARVIEAHNLQVNESLLTGESLPVEKKPDILTGDILIFDQNNMVFKGTTVTGGAGRALVVATGLATEIGSLHKTIAAIDTETPLKHDLDRLSHTIVIGLFVLCAFLFAIGLALGKTVVELLVIITALFICAIPEGLPVVFTLVLVGGVYRMAKQRVLVKKLQAAESLGRTDVIIIDKTGTLTRNEMTVLTVYCQGQHYAVTGEGYQSQGKILVDNEPVIPTSHPSLMLLAEGSALLNNAKVDYFPNGQAQVKGDPTEAAMGIFAEKAGIDLHELQTHYRKVGEIPFSSDLRLHAGFYRHQDTLHIFVAGVPEIIIASCSIVPDWTPEALNNLLAQGLRSLAVAHYQMPFPHNVPGHWLNFFERNVKGRLTFLGLIGMQDALREGIADAVAKARSAGIHVVMATGDHTATARMVGQAAGIIHGTDDVMEGAAFRTLTAQEQMNALRHIRVFSRVTPQDKLLLVDLFHKQGHIVAMTGDGVNDVPPIVAADVGIAMGISGTDITKEAADLILLDDSFSSIVNAIEEGRHIFYTLRRVITYFFATNMGEILIIMIALLANMPLPLLAAQILWLNLVTDGFLDVALAQEPKEQGLLRKKWLKEAQREGLINKHLLVRVLLSAVPMAFGSLALFAWYQDNITIARTITLTSMAMFQWFNAWNCRSETISLFRLNFLTNIWLVLATILVFVLQLAVVYVPLLQKMFHTAPLSFMQWGLIMLISSSIIVIEEVRKAVSAWLTTDNNRSSL